jgi:hypothetical protein
MSRQLLQHLKGGQSCSFSDWLDRHPWEPRIAWYPSSGLDFSDLIYLHQSNLSRVADGLPKAPEIFLHTDCSIQIKPEWPPYWLKTNEGAEIHRDERTRITVIASEELPRLNISKDACLKRYNQIGYGRIFFLLLEIESDRLGTLLQPVVYAVVENGAFASEVLLEKRARISHIWNLSAGDRSFWLGHLLRRFGTECVATDRPFYSDENWDEGSGRKLFCNLFPNIEGRLEDRPIPEDWVEVSGLKDGLHCYKKSISSRQRDDEIIAGLFERSKVCQELRASEIGFSQIHADIAGFRTSMGYVGESERGLPLIGIKEALDASTGAFLSAIGKKGPFKELETPCLEWRSERDGERFDCCYNDSWFLWGGIREYWHDNKRALVNVSFSRNSSFPVEHAFHAIEAFLGVFLNTLQNAFDPSENR